ncbi:hypothetical protein BKA70DRAFT_1228965 [Coprinopsis sp. MPI-PUGE-AT-0042]|nr:hypothetical protein BKA70DRAFT_1228965 [Coprinopsis sp. MPI-PUGE-AT-0042]
MASNSTIAVLQPVVERYITASDGTRIFATAVGQSHLPSLVFVHGYAFSALIWASIMANSDLLKNFYLRKPTTPAGYLSHLFAEDFANIVREFGLDSPVILAGTVAADIFSYLDPGAISGIIYTAAVPWNGQAFQEVAHPYLVNEIQPGLVSFDNVTAAFDSRIKIAESISNKPEKVPTERKWSWIGSAALVGPLSTQLLSHANRTRATTQSGRSWVSYLLITGGKDTFIQSDLLKALLERNFTNMATYDFPKVDTLCFTISKRNIQWLRNSGRSSVVYHIPYGSQTRVVIFYDPIPNGMRFSYLQRRQEGGQAHRWPPTAHSCLTAVVERYITASDGTQIFATAVGQSHLPSLVFVHGYAFSTLIWASILANSDLLRKLHTTYEDTAVAGKPTTSAGYLSNLFAEDFANVVREFGLDSPVYWLILSPLRSYGGTVVADIFSHLDPGTISGIIYTAAVPWADAFQQVAHPYLLNEIMPGLTTFDNVTAALDSRIKFAESISSEPEKVPTERMWSWIGSASLVGPFSAQLLLAREQDPEPLLKAGAAGFPTLLITGGKDTFVQSDVLKAFLDVTLPMAVYDIPEAGHAMFYDFEEEYAKEVAQFASSVFGNKTVA